MYFLLKKILGKNVLQAIFSSLHLFLYLAFYFFNIFAHTPFTSHVISSFSFRNSFVICFTGRLQSLAIRPYQSDLATGDESSTNRSKLGGIPERDDERKWKKKNFLYFYFCYSCFLLHLSAGFNPANKSCTVQTPRTVQSGPTGTPPNHQQDTLRR